MLDLAHLMFEYNQAVHICLGCGSWWHQMETFSTLLALCEGNVLVTSEFPSQRPVTQSFDAFFDLRLNKSLGKQSWGLWFEISSNSLWRHCNVSGWGWTYNSGEGGLSVQHQQSFVGLRRSPVLPAHSSVCRRMSGGCLCTRLCHWGGTVAYGCVMVTALGPVSI